MVPLTHALPRNSSRLLSLLGNTLTTFLGLLVAAAALGWARWWSHGDGRLLGALGRVAAGWLLGLVLGLLVVRWVAPGFPLDVAFGTAFLGAAAGGMWALRWMRSLPRK